jgi:hypothetical protein
MEYRLLGPIQVADAAGRLWIPRGGKQRLTPPTWRETAQHDRARRIGDQYLRG